MMPGTVQHRNGLPLPALVVVVMKGCPACEELKRDALPGVTEYLAARHIPVVVQDAKYARLPFEVQFVPTIVANGPRGMVEYAGEDRGAHAIATFAARALSGRPLGDINVVPHKTTATPSGCSVGGKCAAADRAHWGPEIWRLIHLLAMTYNDVSAAREYAAFYRALAGALPCPECQEHYAAAIRSGGSHALSPAVLADRFSLFAWTVDLHNAVNARLGKDASKGPEHWYRVYHKTMLT
jgi:hypothetical protein